MKFSTHSISAPGKKSPTRRRENQDWILCRELDVGGSQGVLLVVVDGMSSSPFGGSVARWVVEQHLATDKIAFEAGLAADHALRVYLRQLHEQFHEEFAGEGMEDTGFIAPK